MKHVSSDAQAHATAHAPKKSRRRYMPVAVGVAAVVGASLYMFGSSASPSIMPHSNVPPQPLDVTTAAVNRGLPARLKIPELNINTAIQYMGRDKTGSMAVPANSVDVGWYKYGPLPGNLGSSVIAGHLVGQRGQPGVFSKLDKLKIGDVFSVTDDKGLATQFTVHAKHTYGQNEQPAEVFKSTSGSHLNLITCTGDWSRGEHRYQARLVVFADKSS